MGKRRVLIFVESGIWLLSAYFEIPGAQLHTIGQGFDSPLRHDFQSVVVMLEIGADERI